MTTSKDNTFNGNLTVWLNENDQCRMEDIQTILQLIIFHNRDECIDYITNENNQKILLITSSDNAQEFLSVVHILEQIKAIYVLNTVDEKNENKWINQYKKVRVNS